MSWVYSWKNDLKHGNCEKLLSIKVYYQLSLNIQINKMLKKVEQRLSDVPRIVPWMNLLKWRLLPNVFFMSQFTSCPLVRMCHSHPKNNNINGSQERCLRVIYSDKQSIFIQLLVQYKCGFVVYKYLRFFTS